MFIQIWKWLIDLWNYPDDWGERILLIGLILLVVMTVVVSIGSVFNWKKCWCC